MMEHKTETISGEYLDTFQLEMENRIRNLLWTVSQDYSLECKPDVSLFLRSREIALYDGIKQGAFARYFDRDKVSMYLIKKIYCGAEEAPLLVLSQLCVEEAVGERIIAERPGIRDIRRKAFQDILEQEYKEFPPEDQVVDCLRAAFLLENGRGEKRDLPSLKDFIDLQKSAGKAEETMDLISCIDDLYNEAVDPSFERRRGNLAQVMAVTLEELAESGFREELQEELLEEAMESYVEQLSNRMTSLENRDVTEDLEKKRKQNRKITVLPPEALEKSHRYVELNYGKTYLSGQEEKRLNALLCREIHSDCSLYFTEGILKNPVQRNYQYEYAKRLRSKNLYLFHDKYRVVRRNVEDLTRLLRKSLLIRTESQFVLSDRGQILPARLWRVGRSSEANVFQKEIRGDVSDFVVDVLIDASGSQMKRQGEVALQAYMISEALSNVQIPHRVMSYCTFWDYTILQRFRDYDAPAEENDRIFDYVTSSNNRDGLAVRAAGMQLTGRPEEKKILIVLSDGRPYDVIVNRPNARNPKPYHGQYAVADTASEVRRLRTQGVSVLGVFAGEEKDLSAEKTIFGKDFAYIREITAFSRIVGRYLIRQLEED